MARSSLAPWPCPRAIAEGPESAARLDAAANKTKRRTLCELMSCLSCLDRRGPAQVERRSSDLQQRGRAAERRAQSGQLRGKLFRVTGVQGFLQTGQHQRLVRRRRCVKDVPVPRTAIQAPVVHEG